MQGRVGIAFAVLSVVAIAANKVSQEDVERLALQAGMKPAAFVALAEQCERARALALSELARCGRLAREANDAQHAEKFETLRKEIARREHAVFPALAAPLNAGEVGAPPSSISISVLGPRSLLAKWWDWGVEYQVQIDGVSTAEIASPPPRPSRAARDGKGSLNEEAESVAAPAFAGRGQVSSLQYDCFRVVGRGKNRSAPLKLERIDDAPFAEYLRLAYGKKGQGQK